MKKVKFIAKITLLILFLIVSFAWFIVTQPIFFQEKIETDVVVDPIRLEKHVNVLSEKFIPRDYKHPNNLDSVAFYIEKEFSQTGGAVSLQNFEIDSTNYNNVILQLGPKTEERIVIGAHYDAYGEYPGADDNASGVAGLIELARLLEGIDLPIMIELVAYSLEEPPFFRTDKMGSAVHAADLKNSNIPIKLMISLEMIGYFSDEEKSQQFPLSILSLFYPTKGNWIGVVGDFSSFSEVRSVKAPMSGASDLPVYSFNAPPRFIPGIDWSDHLNYWNNEYPAIMITNTAYLRNRSYHTINDTADRLDYNRMALVVKGVYVAILDIIKDYN